MDLSFYNPAKALLYIDEIERGDVIFFDIHPTNICNHACPWCKFTHSKMQLSYSDMVHYIDKYPTVKGVRISGGGEPLVNPNTLLFIEECVRRGIEVGIFTNGGLLNDDNIPIIAKCRFCRISLDSATPETHAKIHKSNDYHRILESIKKLSKTNIRELGVSFMVMKDTLDDILLLPTLNLPVHYIHLKPINTGIDETTRTLALQYLDFLSTMKNIPQLRYSRVVYDQWANRNIPCRITKIIRAIAADNKEYICCEHNYEPDHLIDVWDGDNSKCCNCVYNAYNETLDMYYTDSIAKGFF